MKRIFGLFLIIALGSIATALAWLVIVSTDLRFLPFIRHFSIGDGEIANIRSSDQQEILRHLPIGSSLEDVQNGMKRNGFTCQGIRQGEQYDTGTIYGRGRDRPISDRDFLACYIDRPGLPCRISRRVEIEHRDQRLAKLTVYGDEACL
jgi:hypothetical protein